MKFYFISAVQSSVRNKYNSQIQKQPTQQSISTNNFSKALSKSPKKCNVMYDNDVIYS